MNICPATMTLFIIGFIICLQFIATKPNASVTSAADSNSFIFYRIVSLRVEREQESMLILFVAAKKCFEKALITSRVPGDTSKASTPSLCLFDLHQHDGRPTVVNSPVDIPVSPFIAIGSPVKQFERSHRFFHSAGNDVKDKSLVMI
jgi:hypothetical protein